MKRNRPRPQGDQHSDRSDGRIKQVHFQLSLCDVYSLAADGQGGRLTRGHKRPGGRPAKMAWMRAAKGGKSLSWVADRMPLWGAPCLCKRSKCRRVFAPRTWPTAR